MPFPLSLAWVPQPPTLSVRPPSRVSWGHELGPFSPWGLTPTQEPAAWRLAELEAWVVRAVRAGGTGAGGPGVGSYPPGRLPSAVTWPSEQMEASPGRSQVGARPHHWPHHAWRSAALVRAGGQGRLGEQGPQHAAALPPSSPD